MMFVGRQLEYHGVCLLDLFGDEAESFECFPVGILFVEAVCKRLWLELKSGDGGCIGLTEIDDSL